MILMSFNSLVLHKKKTNNNESLQFMYNMTLDKIAFINFHNTTKCKDLGKKIDDQTNVMMFVTYHFRSRKNC